MMRRHLFSWENLIALNLLFAIAHCGGAEQVPARTPTTTKTANWRNDGSGKWAGVTPPTQWSDQSGILWRTETGSSSFSSLALSGNRLFVATGEADFLCLDAASGKVLWHRQVAKASLPKDQQGRVVETKLESGNTPHTPVVDGKSVYVTFANSIAAAFDLAGTRKWAIALGEQADSDGRSSSPVLADGKMMWLCGHLYAIDCATGKVVWEVEDIHESYGTPIVMTLGGRHVLVTPGGQVVAVSDGKVLADGLGDLLYASPIRSGRRVYWVGESTYAYELPDRADPFEGEEIWLEGLDGEFYASPVLHNKIIYTASDDARIQAVNAENGEVLYEETLPIAPNVETDDEVYLYASLSLAGGMLYVSNTAGETVVFKPGPKYEQVAINRLRDGSGCTPLFSGSRIYTRAGNAVICIGK